MSGAGNRHDVVSLREHPRQRELRRGTLVLLRDFLDPRDQLEVLLEVLALKARVLSPEIVLREVVDFLDMSREKSTAEGTVGYEADVQQPQRVEQSVLGIARPKR